MQFDTNLSASPVYDGLDSAAIPMRMGTPAPGQLQGTPLERLAELAGRVCYDSLGKGRSSEDYHKHILEVGHLSVYEHCQFTVEFKHENPELSWQMCQEIVMLSVNRPGVWLERHGTAVRLTLNMRSLLEWDSWTPCMPAHGSFAQSVRAHLFLIASQEMPAVFSATRVPPQSTRDLVRGMTALPVDPETDAERWVTLLLTGSRGFSHELVRHGNFTAISQRSTRYVDESETSWVDHPLVTQLLRPPIDGHLQKHPTIVTAGNAQHSARKAYDQVCESLEIDLLAGGVGKSTARKQARGAARGYLGNALYTEVIFSASVAQWKRILKQRLSAAADAEIRVIFDIALTRLKSTRYGSCFDSFVTAPSPDGIGKVLR